MTAWGDVNARARGLATHLVAAEEMRELALAPDLTVLAQGLETLGLLTAMPGECTAATLELALRRTTARHFQILTRWLGDRTTLLRIVFEDEERRSLRALIRGAAAGAPSETRLAGLIATPSLPERLLEELARQPRIRGLAELLVTWRHPYGPPILAVAGTRVPDLFLLECEVNATFAARATQGARRGGTMLRAYVSEMLDFDNLRSALLFAGSEPDLPRARVFLPGGRRLDQARLAKAAAATNPAAAARILADAFPGDDIAQLVIRHAAAPHSLEEALLVHRIRKLRNQSRRDPLGPAPLLRYFLRLRAQAVGLGGLVWAAALGVPAAMRREQVARDVLGAA